jgi:hypothetical protein
VIALTIIACLMLMAGCVLAIVAITVPMWLPPLYWQINGLPTPYPAGLESEK